MSDPLNLAISISSSGLEAQTHRMRIISENIANAQVTGTSAGADPYARKTISFRSVMDRENGAEIVSVDRIGVDPRPFKTIHSPGHVAADADGYIKVPNVDLFLELADLREATRSYEANVRVTRQAREMISMSIEMMKA